MVKNGRVEKWSLNLDDANAEIMGPIRMCAADAKRMIAYYDSLSEREKMNLHCFSLFSEQIESIAFSPVFFEDGTWMEIDTQEDLKSATQIFNVP